MRVDGQTKRSFGSLEDAMAAGSQIKEANRFRYCDWHKGW